jgi:hypothetical protein
MFNFSFSLFYIHNYNKFTEAILKPDFNEKSLKAPVRKISKFGRNYQELTNPHDFYL